MIEVVCYVNASVWFSTDNYAKGVLSVVSMSDTHYICQFQNTKKENQLLFDLDDLEYLQDRLRVNIFSKSVEIEVVDAVELSLLLEAIQECRELCEASLRLKSTIRDTYYSGIYNYVDKSDKLVISNELDKFFKSNPMTLFDTVQQIQIEETSSTASTKLINIPSIYCIYCDYFVNNVECPREYLIHPYVPIQGNGDFIHMCIICAQNWKDFRDKAADDNMLQLPGELNEEICAICSDSPQEVILCSSCQRSFCNTCLKRILTIELYEKIEDDDDWKCTCCNYGNISKEPLHRNKWKILNDVCTSKGSPRKSQNLDSPLLKTTIQESCESNINDVNSIPISTISQSLREVGKEVTVNLTSKLRKEKSVEQISNESSCTETSSLQKRKKNSIIKNDKIDKKKKLNNECVSLEPTLSTPLPEAVVDDLFYFQQYLLYYSKLCIECAPKDKLCNTKVKEQLNFYTDDACFLCKDGGDLIECDWKISGKKNSQCRKVYHSGCLNYEVGDEEKQWFCPRHFCDICGSMTLAYACLFCPISMCSKCPEELVRKYGHSLYLELEKPSTGEFTRTKLTTIACQTCLDMMNKIKEKSDISNELKDIVSVHLKNEVKKFPGVPGKEYYSYGGLFKRSSSSDSDSLNIKSTSGESMSQPISKARRNIKNQKYEELDLYSYGNNVSARRQKWTDTEEMAIVKFYDLYGVDYNKLNSDEILRQDLKNRSKSEIESRLHTIHKSKNSTET